MRKTEFLQELREALDGEVSASVIQSNISYYDQYIRHMTKSTKHSTLILKY